MNALILALFALLPPSGEVPCSFGVLMNGRGGADLRQGLSSLKADTLEAVPACSYRAGGFTAQLSAAVDLSTDSSFVAVEPLTAGAFYRWPGSPWVSAGVFRGLREPYLYGLSMPLIPWNSTGTGEMTGTSVGAGGLLGFSGWWNQYEDSVSWYGVSSPWLGFGTIRWDALREDSATGNSITGFADLRVLSPWFVFQEDNGNWTGSMELRGWCPVSNPAMSLEIVPGAAWSEDSSGVTLGGYLTGRARAFSAHLVARGDTDSLESSSVSAGADMLSAGGIHWSGSCLFMGPDRFSSSLSGFYRASPAGCGAGLHTNGDSVAVSATALYAPLPGVSTVLTVHTDLNPDSPDPGCLLSVSGAESRGSANLTVSWSRTVTELRLGVSAWIN